ncbi:hypothetical protein GCM10009584_04160 [Ornithinimicrobium humiphilum]
MAQPGGPQGWTLAGPKEQESAVSGGPVRRVAVSGGQVESGCERLPGPERVSGGPTQRARVV